MDQRWPDAIFPKPRWKLRGRCKIERVMWPGRLMRSEGRGCDCTIELMRLDRIRLHIMRCAVVPFPCVPDPRPSESGGNATSHSLFRGHLRRVGRAVQTAIQRPGGAGDHMAASPRHASPRLVSDFGRFNRTKNRNHIDPLSHISLSLSASAFLLYRPLLMHQRVQRCITPSVMNRRLLKRSSRAETKVLF